MSTPKNILVPVDFSQPSEVALDYAMSLAAKIAASVHVLNVISIPMLGIPEAGIVLTSSMVDDLADGAQKALDKLVDARRKDGRIGQVLLRTGDPREVILQVCEEVSADLIVMSTHGRRGLGRLFLGSVAENVVRTATCPVLTIRARKGGTT